MIHTAKQNYMVREICYIRLFHSSINVNYLATNKQTVIESLYKLLTVAPSSLPGRRPDATMYVLPIVLIFSIPLNFGFSSNYICNEKVQRYIEAIVRPTVACLHMSSIIQAWLCLLH